MGWRSEHGEGFAVPDTIAKVEGIEDLSWHNDAMPCFGCHIDIDAIHGPEHGEHADGCTSDGVTLCIWVDHPDTGLREFPAESRFFVYGRAWDPLGFELLAIAGVPNGEDGKGPNASFDTDDAGEAVVKFFHYLALINAARRAA